MLTFLLIFGFAVAALLAVQAADIECEKPARRRPAAKAASKQGNMAFPTAISGTR